MQNDPVIARSASQVGLDRLSSLIDRHATGFGTPTVVDHQLLVSVNEQAAAEDLRYVPMVCFVARGAKSLLVNDETLMVSRGEMFVGVIDAAVSAAFEAPYRAVTLILDERILANLIVELNEDGRSGHPVDRVFATAIMDERLLDAVSRWVQLNDEPAHAATLSRRVEDEILYRVLIGPLGGSLTRAMAPGHIATVRLATAYLAKKIAHKVSLAELAAVAHCSPSALAKQFRLATGTSPMRFHKQLKLQRARQLLATGSYTAASTASAVGYVSASQFSRDYRQRYGVPPLQHARAL
ncbi:AraC family transcriptional regulator [Micromonospora sp. R77]|uniref:AraC family transcriptional regulator n=1 Tax=Micromonospora sp. R77 TaxID=2925836 RepID=UPI001F6050FB|nr:AraC family transcriptional regulator [Micromonospora sp. R77]MCI4061454.1 AraC family transcriptional regulator [Micromonospora sp. R77]